MMSERRETPFVSKDEESSIECILSSVKRAETLKYLAHIEGLEAERDEALNQLDSARHSVEVLEANVARLWDALEAYASKLEGHEIECPVLSGNTKEENLKND